MASNRIPLHLRGYFIVFIYKDIKLWIKLKEEKLLFKLLNNNIHRICKSKNQVPSMKKVCVTNDTLFISEQ